MDRNDSSRVWIKPSHEVRGHEASWRHYANNPQSSLLVYCMGVDSGGPAQHVLEVKFFYDNAFLY